MPKFNHQCAIGFTVISENEDGEDFTPALLRAALLERIRGLDECQDPAGEWQEAVGIEDTVAEE